MKSAIRLSILSTSEGSQELARQLSDLPELELVEQNPTVVLLDAVAGWQELLEPVTTTEHHPAVVLRIDPGRWPEVVAAVCLQVRVFVDAGEGRAVVFDAVRRAACRESHSSPRFRSALGTDHRGALARLDTLTHQERRVLRRVLRYQKNDEIAAGLLISTRTVKKHVDNICQKLEVHGRLEIFRSLLLSGKLDSE